MPTAAEVYIAGIWPLSSWHPRRIRGGLALLEDHLQAPHRATLLDAEPGP
jgi:hypothetical protein